MVDFDRPAEKINPQDPEAIKKAGFGNPGKKFNPEEEMAEVAADAALVEELNKKEKISNEPAAAPPPSKKAKKTAAKQSAPAETKEETDEEPVEELSDDPTERLTQVGKMIQEQYGESAPGPRELMQWKQAHNDIFVFPVGERTFIYRYLKRAEWNKIQADESLQQLSDVQIDDYLFDRCVLWPQISPQEKASLPAGLISAVVEQIRINSMFIPPERMAQFTIKL